MLTEALPKRVRYPQAGVEDTLLTGVVPINRLPRLAEALLDNGLDHESVPESVAVKLTFSSDGPARVLVVGEASFKQQWRCQRCLEAVVLTSGSDIAMILSSNKKVIEQLGSNQDSLRTEGDLVDTADIIEDQLLLALPMSPKHEDCEAAFQMPDPIAEIPAARPSEVDSMDEIEEGRQRPFAGLKRLTDKD